jgi:hypothetical protein
MASFRFVLAAIIAISQFHAERVSAAATGDFGEHPVGFRILEAFDTARNGFDTGLQNRGRPLHIFLWYPAIASGSQPATYGMYLEALHGAQRAAFAGIKPIPDGAKILAEHITELGGPKDASAVVDTLAARRVMARLNAKHAAGRFPLIIFPDYRAPATMSNLAERLASHGYVVASHATFAATDPEYRAGLEGVESVANDTLFTLNEVSKLACVDQARTGAIGLGIAASSQLTAIMRSARFSALVSLDGGIPTQFEDGILKRTPYFDLTSVSIPILAIMSFHETVKPELWSQYRYADRYLLRFPGVTEFEFHNFGAWTKEFPGIVGKSSGDAALGNDWAARYISAFFDAHLKLDQQALSFLRRSPADNGAAVQIAEHERKTGLARPPGFSVLKQIVERGGVEGLASLHADLKSKGDPAPVSQERFRDLANWLSTRDGDDYSRQMKLAHLRVDSFPNSARAHFALAQTAQQSGDAALAATEFKIAFNLLASDDDPALTDDLRKRIAAAANQTRKS